MKQLISIVVILLALTSIVYGAIKPYKKASLYVRAARAQSTSVQGFIEVFSRALDYSSPVGQDEMVRFVSNDVSSIVGNSKNGKQVAELMTQFLHKYADPKIESEVGMNYAQMIMLVGSVHLNKWNVYKDPQDLTLAIKYFEKGYEINHDRPQFLFGLSELYKISGQKEKFAKVQEHIIELWGGAQ